MSYREILEAALALPTPKRTDLMYKLQDSIEEDTGLSPEWLAEIRRRSEEIDQGKAKFITREEMKKRIGKMKKKLQSKR
jgi:putative addiction module component (TIGR02574 family)